MSDNLAVEGQLEADAVVGHLDGQLQVNTNAGALREEAVLLVQHGVVNVQRHLVSAQPVTLRQKVPCEEWRKECRLGKADERGGGLVFWGGSQKLSGPAALPVLDE